MRGFLAAFAAVFLAACAVEQHDQAGGYTLEVRAAGDAQVFLVTAPDGRAVAGRAADGVSALMDAEAARAFNVLPEGAEALPEVMALRLPGFELSIAAEDGDVEGADGARVSINAAGRQIQVNARDDDGGNNGRAHVRITGASADDARGFINDAEELSAEVKAEMISALDLG